MTIANTNDLMTESPNSLNSRAAASLAAHLLDDKKGRDIQVLEVRELCGFTDYFVIATVETGTQLRALSALLRQAFKQEGDRLILLNETIAGTTWIVVDAGDVVIHIFLPEAREYYNLERLWGDAPELKWKDVEEIEIVRAACKRLQTVRMRGYGIGADPAMMDAEDRAKAGLDD